MENELPPLEVETGASPEYAVIWLHGLGADGSDFVPVVPELGLADKPAVRFIFPHAPYMPVTCNGGYVMRAWYDIISLESTSRRIDEGGIIASRDTVCRLIEREKKRGIPAAHIFLAGFSQGGAVAYTTALTHPEKLAGLIALSTYIPSPDLLTEDTAAANREIPIFAAHGTADDVVSPNLGLAARNLLNKRGYAIDWHDYPMPHSVCLEEVWAIGAWLGEQMRKNSAG
ncbi:alpha/beta hydrolase [Dechloromonas sp. HYN0024]|uniref:alpha/beta hydrolase n=1 Tax=Dechloromonas sp. HYN0024 TaxID=2231055 RepID=UPI000E4345EB|nr:carboxylesterase [Dechloromonas sp. HYN0024]AXS80319.1 carboxylesterase [Dechloromonas sp. HYN0024]